MQNEHGFWSPMRPSPAPRSEPPDDQQRQDQHESMEQHAPHALRPLDIAPAADALDAPSSAERASSPTPADEMGCAPLSQQPQRMASAGPGDCASLAAAAEAARPVRDVLDALAQGSLGPLAHVNDTVNLTLRDLSEWIADARNRRQIIRLISLLDAQTQLIVAQQQLFAAARLAEVASTAAAPETVRRACADLLRVRLFDPYREEKRPPEPPVPEQLDTEAILAAFERIGNMD
jgi:hypothetical protein